MKYVERTEERTGVQEYAPYARRNDVQCDFVMIYGLHDLKKRVAEWKMHGYIVHLMTGVSWGEYQDYLYGKTDGRDHHDEGQKNSSGSEINHGPDVPYMVPTVAFADYLTQKLRNAVDAGVEAIHLEEPEFWVEAGYSDAFRREWQLYYREPWQDPEATADGQYRASRLKQYLYTRMLDRLCSALKEYALVKYNRLLRFYVPTHSLINYAQWKIVSPESALIDLPGVDGYIAQIWTGTSRTKNTYKGITRERTFETAFLEYGVMQELVRGTGRKIWFLHDPVEDDPGHTWQDYRDNYYRTVTASLFHPDVCSYEVCPWPNRVFNGKYPSGVDATLEGIPSEYATNLLTVMHTLRDMNQGDDTAFDQKVPQIGLLLADSCMYQRVLPKTDPRYDENRGITWPDFYGLALPLLKHGLAVRPVQLDNVRRFSSYLDSYHALVLSYEFMKPESPDIHKVLAGWVKDGGLLVYVGDGSDAFHTIRCWWNEGNKQYPDPSMHLFEVLGLPKSLPDGLYPIGRGYVAKLGVRPADVAASRSLATKYREVVRHGLDAVGIEYSDGARLIFRRGKYVIAAVLDESAEDKPVVIKGKYVDLYSAGLTVIDNPSLTPGSVGLYYDLEKTEGKPDIIAIAARAENIKTSKHSFSYRAVGPDGVVCAARIALDKPPISVSATLCKENIPIDSIYDHKSRTLLLLFDNSPDGVQIQIKF